jgi:hypothetical protein
VKKPTRDGIILPARIREYYNVLFLKTPVPFRNIDGSISLRYGDTPDMP